MTKFERLVLHALSLILRHVGTGDHIKEFAAELDDAAGDTIPPSNETGRG